MKRCSELILSEDRPEVVWVDYHVVTISPFRVDIPAPCQGVQLHSKASRAKAYDQIELIEVFGPPYLPMSEKLSCREILEVFVISKYFNWVWRAFEVVVPLLESSEDSQKLFVVGVIVLFSGRKGAGVKSNRVYFTIIQESGEDSSESVVRSVHFYYKLITWSPVDKNRGQSESLLEHLKRRAALAVKIPRGILVRELS